MDQGDKSKDNDSTSYIPNIVVTSSGTKFYGNVTAKDFFDSFQHFKAKTTTVLNTPSPLIGPLVGSIVKKLGDKKSAAALY